MQNLKKFTVSLTLEDDLHTGNGLGSHLIDAFQAKDKNGDPVISRQHFKGVLKSIADEWKAIAKHNKETEEEALLVSPLFNEKHAEAANVHLIFGSFYLDGSNNTGDHSIVWSSSARGKNNDSMNRAPQDKSLRSVEYIKAGTRFTSTLYLYAPQDKLTAYSDLLTKMLNRVTRLGAKRHRGAGGVTLEISHPPVDEHSAQTNSLSSNSQHLSQETNEQQTDYRIKFTNLEPLRLPNTQIPDNIIPTDTFIASPKLRAALANAARLLGKQELFEYLVDAQEGSKKASFSNAYPLPTNEFDESIPWPQTLQMTKESASPDAQLPWWVQNSNKTIIDTLNKEPEAGQSVKRNKAPSYLVKNDSQSEWHYFTQDVQIHMRNKVRSRNLDKSQDDSELFSEEVLPENGYFSATLSLLNQPMGLELIEFIKQMQQQQVPITIGRGKAPCIITSIDAIESTNEQQTFDHGQNLTLVLTSDWLIYNLNTLRPHQQLNGQLINDAFALTLSDKQIEDLEKAIKNITETKTVVQFNFASQLPSKPVKVISAGSVIQFSASLSKDILDTIKNALDNQQAVGERTQQGYGRFYYYSGELIVNKYLQAQHAAKFPHTQRETYLAKVQKMLQETTKIKGSLSQWQDIHANLNALSLQPTTNKNTLEEFIKSIQSQKQKGKQELTNNQTLFNKWTQQIADLCHQDTIADALQFSLLLVKSIIHQLKQKKTPTNDQGAVKHG